MTAAWDGKLIKPFAATTKHGTENGYRNFGCRCAACRVAHNAYTERRRVIRSALPPEALEHGKPSTYGNYKCRCADCRSAAAADARARRARRAVSL